MRSPGRKPLHPEGDHRAAIRFPDNEIEHYEALSSAEGLSLSQYVRMCMRKMHEKTLAKLTPQK